MPQTAPAPSAAGRARSTPLARAVAADLGVDLAAVTGSGRGGRIVRADVEAYAAAPPVAAPDPQPVYLTTVVDAEELLRFSAELRLDLHDLVDRACATLAAADPDRPVRVAVAPAVGEGVERVMAVLDPPQAAVLAVGAAAAEPVATGDGAVAVRRRLRLTLTVDQRVLDPAAGAELLRRLRLVLERPLQLVV